MHVKFVSVKWVSKKRPACQGLWPSQNEKDVQANMHARALTFAKISTTDLVGSK